MCECDEFLNLLIAYEARISNVNEHAALRKREVEIALGYIHSWPQRQCMCGYRDIKNFDRFNLIVQSIICLTVTKLKKIKELLEDLTLANKSVNDSIAATVANNSEKPTEPVIDETPENVEATPEEEKKPESVEPTVITAVAATPEPAKPVAPLSVPKINDDETYDKWTLPEIEKLLIFISKVFLLNFPLYVAYKHGVHARLDEISPQEAQSLNLFCDLHDNEIPAFLLRNVSIFCNSGGFPAMMECFNYPNLPVSTAHAITAAISNLKLWLNYRSIIQQFVPLRIKVLQYMCKLSDQDLRSASTKSMAEYFSISDFMWAAIKDPLESQITFDTEGLALAFKYFTSSTLTMRLAGMSQINAHINLFNDIWSSETISDVEVVGQKLADWLTENQIIQHLFGPNLHVEVIKQSHIVLTFLAVENQITEEHISLIWQAAQLKHCSKPIYDILPALIKNLASRPAQHLYSLICRLDPKEHTKQSIYIASALIKLIWTRDASRQLVNDVTNACLMQEVAELASSSENSVSVDGSNSEDEEEDEHPDDDDDSSDVGVGGAVAGGVRVSVGGHHKNPLEIDATSDSGAPPCKQARHKNCCDETSDDSSIKVEPDIYDLKRRKKKALMCRMLEGSSSGDCLDDDVENYSVMRKKFRKKRKVKKIGPVCPDGGSDGESECEEESHSDIVTGAADDSDDCSDANLQISAINQAITDGSIIEFLNAVENDGSCSSPMSAKSEKNMGDFEDEDDDPCDEELAELAARSACLAQFQIPRARQMQLQMQQLQMQRAMTPNLVVGKRHASSPIKVMTAAAKLQHQQHQQHHNQMTMLLQSNRYAEICQPGNTLLWDLLQDDKIGLLSENLALEAERALGNLLCYTDKFIKMSFIEGCLQNLAANKTVIVSLRLLPRLLASFRDPDMNTHQVTMWAERNHKLMHHFMNNLKFYATAHQKNQTQGLVLNSQGGLLYSHVQQIQVRLEFLSSIFSDMGSPRSFRLTLNQVDILWSSLGHDPDCADCLFAWLQGQTNAGDMHALGLNALQHLYLKKLPELRPEGISMVALGLFQQLFIKGRAELAKQALLANAPVQNAANNEALDIVGMRNLWKIALRANNTDVSLAAIQYINTYYMEQQLKLENEFVSQCMDHLVQAADDLKRMGDQREHALMCVQRALMLLNTHLETFRRRYAYHLRRWALEGNGIGSHSALRSEGNGPPLRIILQPGGLPDKSVLHLHTTDLVADLKAEIGKWWETLQGSVKTAGGTNAPVLGFLLSEGPLRIITQGQEITAEYDERSLADVGFKDNQMVYVSLGGRGGSAGAGPNGGSTGRRKEQTDYSASLPAPSRDCLPTLLLLKSPYFEQLFSLMQTLGDMRAVGKGGHIQPHTKAQLLSRRVWDILAMLPTSPGFLETLKNLSFVDNADAERSAGASDNSQIRYSLQTILDPSNLQKFMYSLHIVETLCKSKFASNCCNTNKSNVVTKSSTSSSSSGSGCQAKAKSSVGKSGNGKSGQKKGAKAEVTETLVTTTDEPMTSEEPEAEKIEEIHNPSTYDVGTDEKPNGENPVIPENSEPATSEHSPQKTDPTTPPTSDWNSMFVKCGGLSHLFSIFMSGILQNMDEHDSNEWRHDCLASLLRILCLLGVEDMKPSEKVIVIPKLNDDMLKIMQVKSTLKRITSILDEASLPVNPNQFKTGFYGRAQIVHFSMNLLVCFAHSSAEARELIWTEPTKWLQRLILDDPEPSVRREACAALYRLCLGNAKTYPELMGPLLMRLVRFLPMAEKMTLPQSHNSYTSFSSAEEGKEPYGPACRDYFWLLCRLVDTLTPDLVKESLEDPSNCTINIELLCRQVSISILERDHLEARYNQQDDGLFGLLNLMGNLIKYDPPYKFSPDGQDFIDKIFDCLFALPSPQNREQPKCKAQSTRAAAYDLLVELSKGSPKNYILLHHRLMQQHRPGPHSPYPWDYWPRDDGRSDVGYVGLTNLGATCYMASCIQHIYMMPQARDAILSVPAEAPQKHKATLHELQRMFAYLMESERKSYNPRSFCRVYQMDHQPLNTGEQKDMAEFFIDLVSKLEEITPNLKNMVKRIFCGVLSNNVVSLDCGHVSRTLEEFYTVRCQVADMRNLHESLDEVTVKDTLEGDNMYTCSQCGRKVRAEKRACFKKLPQILCFNTMRYTFNMVTMLKEKVNTHFSFPMRLDMSRYVEKTLMPQHYQEEKRNAQLRRTGSRNTSESEALNGSGESNTPVGSWSDLSKTSCSTDSPSSMESKEGSCGKASPESTEADPNLQKKFDEEDSEDFNEQYEYDLVGVTVHTGTADGGHYYSFIRERGNTSGQPDRWFLFNDAEVKIFDPSQIAAECFGGEMTSKTYDSVTEKYLDFSFEKTNSAYMLFYEWRSNRGGNEQRDQFDTPTTSNVANELNLLHQKLKETQAKQQAMEAETSKATPAGDTLEVTSKPEGVEAPAAPEAATSTRISGPADDGDSLVRSKSETEIKDIDNSILKATNLDIVRTKCDIEIKRSTLALLATPPPPPPPLLPRPTSLSSSSSSSESLSVAVAGKPTAPQSTLPKRKVVVKSSHRSLLSKELEDWIWQDNRHFLQDKNVFEHTYFNFMWQICGHIPQTLHMLPDITCIAAQLSVSFFIETFIHAKEKPTMVLWVELLTKQFNASQEACEWFLRHMSNEPWWPVQVLIQCPNQICRQMFQRLVIHVIQRLRSTHHQLYLKIETDDESGNVKEEVGAASCVTKFIKSLILLMEHGAKAHLRHLSEFFGLLYEFSRMGEEESLFLLRINVIRSVADFYLGNKNQDCVEPCSDNDDNSSDEALVADKTRPASLDKMIALVASLVERSRGPDLRIHLSTSDYNAIAGGKGFPFLYQQIKDNINPHQTRNLICALCRWDERLASQIIEMLFTAVTKHTELCGPFFKLLTLLTESSSGPSGLPCFSQLVLQRVWEAAEYCPQSALEWLAIQAPRNKIAHAWILQSAGNWVEQFLIAHHNIRVRNAAAYLLVSLVPSQPFRSNFRTTSHHKIAMHQPQRELTGEAQIILHAILSLLLRLLRAAKNYTEIQVHGTTKLTSYFTLMSYCMITKTEKLMLGPFLNSLWQLFHPRLSEPSVPAHHNKQALLAFWYHATVDCPENAELVATCPEITRNIAFNYILADHDDTEIVAYNRCMLPVYYGLLRLCCQQSKALTRQLAAHQNLQWAFKNITPHPTQYPLAVDELFNLMKLFADRQQQTTREAATAAEIAAAAVEQREISLFRRNTLNAYLSGLDARVSWGTLIPALKILVDNDEDRLFVVLNGGIPMCFDALHTLHSMYHEATACHVAGDLQELLSEIILLVRIFTRSCGGSMAANANAAKAAACGSQPTTPPNQQPSSPVQPARPPSGVLKGLQEAVRRLITLLNTYNPPEMRNLSLEVLKELVKCSSSVVISTLLPLLSHCHTQTNSHSLGPIGAYFPRRGTKANWPPVSKTTPRPPRPMIQMNIPITQMIEKGSDRDFDEALETFYRPYHDFLDVMFRMAVTTNQFDESLTTLSCLTGIEGGALHFNLFPKFWVGIFNNKHTNRLSELLITNPLLPDYIDTVLRDERMSLNDSIIANFIEIYYPKVKSRIQVPRLLETICHMLVNKKNLEDICGDLHAIRIIAQANGIPLGVKVTLQNCLQKVLLRFKEELMSEEESPPKKRKLELLDGTASTTASSSDEKMESDASTSQIKPVSESDSSAHKLDDSLTPTDISMTSTDMNSTFGSGMTAEMTEHEIRKNFIKDIESHIEIIFECIEEDDDEDDEKKTDVRVGAAAESPAIVGLLKSAEPLIKTPPAPMTPVVEATPAETSAEKVVEAVVESTANVAGEEEAAQKDETEVVKTVEEADTVKEPDATEK